VVATDLAAILLRTWWLDSHHSGDPIADREAVIGDHSCAENVTNADPKPRSYQLNEETSMPPLSLTSDWLALLLGLAAKTVTRVA